MQKDAKTSFANGQEVLPKPPCHHGFSQSNIRTPSLTPTWESTRWAPGRRSCPESCQKIFRNPENFGMGLRNLRPEVFTAVKSSGPESGLLGLPEQTPDSGDWACATAGNLWVRFICGGSVKTPRRACAGGCTICLLMRAGARLRATFVCAGGSGNVSASQLLP